MRIAVVLLLVASCKKDPCEAAGNHMFGAISKHTAAWLSLAPEELDAAKASVIEDCKMRPWDDGASSCIGRAIDAKDLEACAAMGNVSRWRELVMQQVDPNGTKRYADLDALIAEVLTADKAVGSEAGECTGPVPVIAFDRKIIQSLAANKALPERTTYVGPDATDALARYLAKQKVDAWEVLRLRKWIKELPKDRAWGIVETESRVEPAVADSKTFIEGEYLGTVHVVRGANVLCQRMFAARSSESVKTYFIKDKALIKIDDQLQSDLKKNIDDALETRLVKLKRGDGDEIAQVGKFAAELVKPKTKWSCTVKRDAPTVSQCADGPKSCELLRALGTDHEACTPYEKVTCLTFREKASKEATLSCHVSAESCATTRRAVLAIPDSPIADVSRCVAL
jgi:hypothetical protein